ncbi:hypothetical protein GCM10022223_05100 [Kineosporia mesophila]|uniref:Uncharacterized protein n=1 Tax=Kineosporia mesophila TaxID=566012 RepID=A0ABP6YYS0_9ACTN|nr:hypothetical protein [Kineosporia mesophila]MCD5354279.1 hypothetical protein [Kineosporia mesophila]
MTSRSPSTAPTTTLRLVRQGRHAAAPEPEIEPGSEMALAMLMSQAFDQPGALDRPMVVKQRIARDAGNLRRLRRVLTDVSDPVRRAETQAAVRTLSEHIAAENDALDQMIEQGRTRRWGPNDFEPGDRVRYLSVWYEVITVGPIGLTVRFHRPRDGSSWDVPAEYAKVTGRRRNGVEDIDAA